MSHIRSGKLIFPKVEDSILKAYAEDMSKMIPSSPIVPKQMHGNVTASTMNVKNQNKLDMTQQINDQQFSEDAEEVDIGSTVPKPIKLSVRLENLLKKTRKEPISERSERLFGPEVPEDKALKTYERYVKIRKRLEEEKDKGEKVLNSVNSGDLFKTTHNLYNRAIRKCTGTSMAICGPGDEPLDLIKEEGSKPRKKKKEKK
jgi:hypothetical protein